MTPDRLTRPSVGLIPTMPQHVDGETIEPSVSVPIATAQRLAATATPEPELDPDGVRSRAYGLRHCPPRPLQSCVRSDGCKSIARPLFGMNRIIPSAGILSRYLWDTTLD